MATSTKYASMEDAINSLSSLFENLDAPIDTFNQQTSRIGESDTDAWSGTAAGSTTGVSTQLGTDLSRLQTLINTYKEEIKQNSTNLQEQDKLAQNQIDSVIEK